MLPVPSDAWGKNSVGSPVVSDFAICATNCPLPTPPSPQSSVISPRCRNPEASFSHFLGVTLLSRRSTPPSWASISSTRPSPMAGAVGFATGAVSCTTPSSATCAFRGNCSRFVLKMSFFSHVHIPPCPNKFLTMSVFKVLHPTFTEEPSAPPFRVSLRVASVTAPTHRARLSGCRARPGLAGCALLRGCTSISHLEGFVQWFFEKKSTRLATRHFWIIFQILTVNHCSGSKKSDVEPPSRVCVHINTIS